MHVDKRIREESERVEFYLQDCSRKTLMALLDAAYIVPHLMPLAEKGLLLQSFYFRLQHVNVWNVF